MHWNKKCSVDCKSNIVCDTRETMFLLVSTWYLWGILQHRQQVAILHCLLNCWFKRSSKKTSKLHVTGLRAWHSPVTSVFLAQKASNAENVSIFPLRASQHTIHPHSISTSIRECICNDSNINYISLVTWLTIWCGFWSILSYHVQDFSK